VKRSDRSQETFPAEQHATRDALLWARKWNVPVFRSKFHSIAELIPDDALSKHGMHLHQVFDSRKDVNLSWEACVKRWGTLM